MLDVGQTRDRVPENFISFNEVFGDPMQLQRACDERAGRSIFWEYVRGLGLKPENYWATQCANRHGWLLIRKQEQDG